MVKKDTTQYGGWKEYKETLKYHPLWARLMIRMDKPRPWWRNKTKQRGSLKMALRQRILYIRGARGLKT